MVLCISFFVSKSVNNADEYVKNGGVRAIVKNGGVQEYVENGRVMF